jgi:hypothetical protein
MICAAPLAFGEFQLETSKISSASMEINGVMR